MGSLVSDRSSSAVELDDDLARIFAELQRVAVPPDPDACRQRVLQLARVRNLADALHLEHVALLHRTEPEDTFARETCTDWLASHLHLARGSAYGQVCTARELHQLPLTNEALHRGELSSQQASVVAQAVRRVRKDCPERAADVEQEMVGAAHHLDPRELTSQGFKLYYALDQQAATRTQADERRRRFFELSQRQDGWYDCQGFLDSEAGALLRLAIRGQSGKRAKDDERTPGQRRHDALAEVARHRLDAGDLPQQGQEKPHLTIVVDAETLRDTPGSPPAVLDWGVPVCGETAKRHLCDASVRLALVGDRGDGVFSTLHMGRAFRTTTIAQRKALELRDGGCLWPSCEGHPNECTSHHFLAWSAGGPTDDENLGLVCGRHHWNVHEGRFVVRENAKGQAEVIRPDGVLYGTVARHRWRRLTNDGP